MSESYQVRYSPQALEDLKDVYSYIAYDLQEPGTAAAQTERIRKLIRSLDFLPLRFGVVDWEPWKSMGMRKAPVNHFVVFYTVDSATKTVMIIRIVYGGRDLTRIALEDNT